MRQAVFVKQNEKKWLTYENAVANLVSLSADKVSEMYVHLTEDLAFAKANYSGSKLHTYLEDLTLKIHHHIYRNKPEKKSRFITFWTQELPFELKQSKKNILYAFIITAVGVCLGALSASNDTGFARMFLGDEYVNMTYENIESGDPMAVYKSMGETDMFFKITVNNIRVSLMAFAFGIIGSLGTAFILFQNGIMLGVFHWLFFSKGIFDDTILTIWIHGTLEISAIIIAGAAGLAMGNGLLFPGNFPRAYSFKKGARRGLKIVLSLVPFFVVAGFLESVVTRKTEWPLSVKMLIIAISLLIVITYLFVLPNLKTHESKDH